MKKPIAPASLSSIFVTFVVVVLYAIFLLVERRGFETKLSNLSPDPQRVARIRELIRVINRRIGSYLALKTLLSIPDAIATRTVSGFDARQLRLRVS